MMVLPNFLKRTDYRAAVGGFFRTYQQHNSQCRVHFNLGIIAHATSDFVFALLSLGLGLGCTNIKLGTTNHHSRGSVIRGLMT